MIPGQTCNGDTGISSGPASPGDCGLPRFLRAPRSFLLALAALFTTYVGLRLITSPIPNIDESWQLVCAQEWSWSYFAHPPLYTWLQILFFKVLGESIFALSLLKNSLLFALYLFIYRAARLLTRRHEMAAWATLCLLLIPQIAWESQRDLTHSVLLSAMTAGTLWSFLALMERATTGRYACLGLFAALALLSKYNAGVFIFGALCASLIVPSCRAVVLAPRMMVAVAVFVAVVGPHFWWMIQHWDDATSSTERLVSGARAFGLTTLLLTPWTVIRAFSPNLIPLAVIYALARGKRPFTFRHDMARLIFWTAVICLALFGVAVLAGKLGHLRGRWFQPLFVCAPILLIAQLATVPRFLFRLVPVLAALVTAAVMTLIPWHVWRGVGSNNRDLTAATVKDALSGAGAMLDSCDVIIADPIWAGGAMRHATGKPVVTREAAPFKPTATTRCCVVFKPTGAGTLPPQFRAFVESFTGRPPRLRNLYLTPASDSKRTGIRLGVAELE